MASKVKTLTSSGMALSCLTPTPWRARAAAHSGTLRFARRYGPCSPYRAYSTEPPPPPLLLKIKSDLKTAMKAKDTVRLNALRSIISEALNASKTASPVRTDVQLVSLLKKSVRSMTAAADEFKQAGREDLVGKEMGQVGVLLEYIGGSGVQELGEKELREIIAAVTADVATDGIHPKQRRGEIMKRIMAPGGPLEGKAVEKAEVAKMVMEMTPQ